MTAEAAVDPLRERVLQWLGKPLSGSGSSIAPDEVNVPMIRHWVDALDDQNPVYLDPEAAAKGRFGGIVAPPAMLQTWTMARPRIEGIAERGGAATAIDEESPLGFLAAAGLTGTLATNSELEFVRYLRPGDRLESSTKLDSVSDRKTTGLGRGFFITWVTTYRALAEDGTPGEVVGGQTFRIFKFDPTTTAEPGARTSGSQRAAEALPEPGEALPELNLYVTATVVVAGAIASRDFMPVHHDRDYAQAQGAPDLFMNILTSTGYVARFVTDWAGPQARLQRIAIRLGAPCVPGHVLRFTGHVEDDRIEGDQRLVQVRLKAANTFGNHVTGTVTLDLPA
jgi:acyl dehydratase